MTDPFATLFNDDLLPMPEPIRSVMLDIRANGHVQIAHPSSKSGYGPNGYRIQVIIDVPDEISAAAVARQYARVAFDCAPRIACPVAWSQIADKPQGHIVRTYDDQMILDPEGSDTLVYAWVGPHTSAR